MFNKVCIVVIIALLSIITYKLWSMTPNITYNTYPTTNKYSIVKNYITNYTATQESKPKPVLRPITPITKESAVEIQNSSFITAYADGSMYVGHTLNFGQDTAISLTIDHGSSYDNAGISVSKRW